MDKLKKINDSIKEIRDMFGADCLSIDELPGLVRDMTIGSGKGGFTTAFVFSSEDNPVTPTGGKMDITTGVLSGLAKG